MTRIEPELIQFFEDHKQNYNFLLHRTHDRESAVSIMNRGLYFEDKLAKVTDVLAGSVDGALIGNKIFFKSYGDYIIILAFPREVNYFSESIVEEVEPKELVGVFSPDEINDFGDMYRLPNKYILGFTESFNRKLTFNKYFEKGVQFC